LPLLPFVSSTAPNESIRTCNSEIHSEVNALLLAAFPAP
jgi:hypothetical protein